MEGDRFEVTESITISEVGLVGLNKTEVVPDRIEKFYNIRFGLVRVL
jgi:hypothetical protein